MSDEIEEVSRKIVDLVSSHIDVPWSRASVDAEFEGSLVDFGLRCFDSNGEEQELDMEIYFSVVRGLREFFVRLREITEDKEKGRWTKCMLTFRNGGGLDREYFYGPSRWAG